MFVAPLAITFHLVHASPKVESKQMSTSSNTSLESKSQALEEPAQTKTVDQLINQYFGSQANQARKIQACENGKRIAGAQHTNSDGSVDTGIFQINSVHRNKVQGDINKLKDPEVNIRVAAQIYHEQGNFSAWTCSKVLR